MQIDLESDSNFFCGIVYSSAPGSKLPGKEGGSAGGACVLFWKGCLDGAARAAEPSGHSGQL